MKKLNLDYKYETQKGYKVVDLEFDREELKLYGRVILPKNGDKIIAWDPDGTHPHNDAYSLVMCANQPGDIEPEKVALTVQVLKAKIKEFNEELPDCLKESSYTFAQKLEIVMNKKLIVENEIDALKSVHFMELILKNLEDL